MRLFNFYCVVMLSAASLSVFRSHFFVDFSVYTTRPQRAANFYKRFHENLFFFLSPHLSPIPPAENMKAPLQRSRSRQNINFNSTRAPTAQEPHYESEPHPSAAHRPTHRPEREKERAREREKEKEQTPTLCSSNGDTDVEALLARLRAL